MPKSSGTVRRSQRPRYVAGFDTEDDSHGNPHLFTCTHEKGSFHATTRTAFLDKLRDLALDVWRSGKLLEAWATNLEYDLVNVFGMERLGEVRFRFGRSYLVAATWKEIDFRDTVRHLPVGVAELGKLVGLRKLRRSRSLRYAMRDSSITYRAARFLHTTYARFHVRPRTTLASTAFAIWDREFFDRTVYPAPPEIRKAAQVAYHGGRTEPFLIGSRERVRAIDVASMYPWAMTQGDFPIVWGPYRRVRAGDDPQATGLYKVRLSIKSSPGPIPFRTENGTIYPIGTWDTWITGDEALYLREIGEGVSILGGYLFLETCRPFDDYVSTLFTLKNKTRGSERVLYKLLLNALYGKFGQKGGRIVFQPLRAYEKRSDPPPARIWGGQAIYRVEGSPPPWGNVLWAAIVTARARIRLHRELLRVRASGGVPLYCDTDSIIFNGCPLRYPKKASAAGEFETRGAYRSVRIEGKKEYGLEVRKGLWIIHAKGIPGDVAKGDYLRTGHARFNKPMRLLEATTRGMQPNVWSVREKQRRVTYKERRRTADGTLAPLIVRSGRLIG